MEVRRKFSAAYLFLSILTVIGLTLFLAPPVGAFSFQELFGNVKDLFRPDIPKELNIQSNIELVSDGDVNKNGQIDAGDIVRFTYIITNTMDQEVSFATLETNIDRNQLNFIHNVYGTASLGDDGKSITIPNFRIGAGQIVTIHFDARVNYFTDNDVSIATEPELTDKDNKSIVKSTRKEIGAKKINKEKIPGMMKQGVKDNL